MDLDRLDKRLQERLRRNRELSEEDIRKAGAKLPDLASNVRELDEEEAEKLKAELEEEGAGRKDRVKWILESGRRETPVPRPEPIPEFEE
ncbi:MAG: hypothetical protein V3T14_01270 [Myxococcota bacterium]